MMDAMRARGVDLPSRQLYAVCSTFNEALDSLTSLAASHSNDRSNEIIQEARLMLTRYLAQYLD